MTNPPTYERDPRATRLRTRVIDSGTAEGRDFVVLADTVLYPEGGGQPADTGSISGIPVLDVQRVEGQIRHVLDGPLGREASEEGAVEVVLDWPRRFDHMQQHTAQHLLTAIAADRFGWDTTAFHLGPAVSDIELDVDVLSSADIDALEEAVAVEVRAARSVTSRRVSRDEYESFAVRSRGLPAGHSGPVRLVEIEGIDLNTCGGTHCGSTAELEAVKLLGTESVRGGTRLFYVAGARLRRRLATEVERSAELRTLLGAGDDDITAAVAARLEQAKEQGRTVRRLQEELADAAARELAGKGEPIVEAHWDDRDLPFLQRVARELDAVAPSCGALLTAGDDASGFFLVSAGPSAPLDVAKVGPEVGELLEGRGGGAGRLYQGRVGSWARRDDAVAVLRGSSDS